MGLEKKTGGLEKYLRTPAHLCRLNSPSRHVVPRARSLRDVLCVGTRADGRVACCALGGYSCAIGEAGGGGGPGGPVGRNVCMARKGIHVCGVKNALQTALDRKRWRKFGGGGGGENRLEKNAKMLEKIIIIYNHHPHESDCS